MDNDERHEPDRDTPPDWYMQDCFFCGEVIHDHGEEFIISDHNEEFAIAIQNSETYHFAHEKCLNEQSNKKGE